MSDLNPIPERIVAELSKTWDYDIPRDPVWLALKFEICIAKNRDRGYELESWKMTQTLTGALVETIVAVFVNRNLRE